MFSWVYYFRIFPRKSASSYSRCGVFQITSPSSVRIGHVDLLSTTPCDSSGSCGPQSHSRFPTELKRLAGNSTIDTTFALEAGSTAGATIPFAQSSRTTGKGNTAAAGGTLRLARSPYLSRGVPAGGGRLRGKFTAGVQSSWSCAARRGSSPDGVPMDATVFCRRCSGICGSVIRVLGSRGAHSGGEGVPPWRVARGHRSGRSSPPAPAVDSRSQ